MGNLFGLQEEQHRAIAAIHCLASEYEQPDGHAAIVGGTEKHFRLKFAFGIQLIGQQQIIGLEIYAGIFEETQKSRTNTARRTATGEGFIHDDVARAPLPQDRNGFGIRLREKKFAATPALACVGLVMGILLPTLRLRSRNPTTPSRYRRWAGIDNSAQVAPAISGIEKARVSKRLGRRGAHPT